jgi:hypothetical protein
VGTVAHNDYPPAALRIPQLDDANRIDLERVLALQPGLVVAWDSGNDPSQLAFLERLAVLLRPVHRPGRVPDSRPVSPGRRERSSHRRKTTSAAPTLIAESATLKAGQYQLW